MDRCQSIVNGVVDGPVVNEFLQALTPAHLEVAIEAFSQIGAQYSEVERQLNLRLKQARHEEKLASQRFMKADPENALVFPRLQRQWNRKLIEVDRLEREVESLSTQTPRSLTALDRQAILALTKDLPKLWHDDKITNQERKQLLRYLIKDVTITKAESIIQIGIRWQTDITTETIVKLPSKSDLLRTDKEVLDRVLKLAQDHSDRQIADILNDEGIKSKFGKLYNAANINRLRLKHMIPTHCPENRKYLLEQQRGDGRYTTTYVAKLLGMDATTVGNWCDQGRLDAIRHHPLGPRWIKITPEQIPKLKKMKWRRRI